VTKRGEGEAWNVSDARDGATGCFLNAAGRHDRILILSLDGKLVSVRSFAGQRLSSAQQHDPARVRGNARGVQSFRVADTAVSQVFRSPFSSWCAVVYEDAARRRLVVSSNSFRSTPSFEDTGGGDGRACDDMFLADDESAMALQAGERVLDVRWQKLPVGPRAPEQYLGAIMTNARVYVVRDVFEPVAKFDFSSIDRAVVPFTVPTMCWVGPAVMILFGQYLYAVTLDGEADLIAGMSQGENACALAAALPDGIVYIRPPPGKSLPVSVSSRPIGMMSVLVRGMLALPSARKNDGTYYIDKLKDILVSHDASQGSEALIDALIRNDLSPIAYILATAEVGQHNLPTLKRAALLGSIGDLRGALGVAEAEYSRLPSADAFHDGTELYRLLQRILNMAMASGDFAVGERCSELLGRRGTFSAFVDQEGGYAAVMALTKYAKKTGNPGIAEALTALMEKSAKSCIATDESRLPSSAQMRNTRAGIESYDRGAVRLGTEDRAEITITRPPAEGADGTFGHAQRQPLSPVSVGRFVDRLEGTDCDEVRALKGAIHLDGGDGGDGMYADAGDLAGGAGGGPLAANFGGGNLGAPGELLASGGLPSLEMPLVPPEKVDFQQEAAGHGAALRTVAEDVGLHAQSVAARAGADAGRRGAQGRQGLHGAAEDNAAVLRFEVGHRPDQQAQSALQAAFMKMNERRYSSALREVRRGLRTLGRATNDDGFIVQPDQVAELVHYLVALQLLAAIDSVSQSPQASLLGGRMTLVQYATALTALPLRPEHRFPVLLLAVNANLAVDNYGCAMQVMRAVRELGVPDVLREDLRAKYALCSARGGVDRAPALNSRYVRAGRGARGPARAAFLL
jgi:hypothetical protein